MISLREVGTANALAEEGIARKERLRLLVIERHATWSVARRRNYAQSGVSKVNLLGRGEVNVDSSRQLANLESIEVLEADSEAPLCATALAGELEILVPMAGLIDQQAELARLGKELDKVTKETERLRGKLENPRFVDKAPAEVVQKEREKLAEAEQALLRLRTSYDQIAAL